MADQDIGPWLAQRGLAEHGPLLREHGVDTSVLPLLTDEHLREIGLPLGARLKLLAAVQQDQPARVERRQLTVLFADLVGSTPLSVQLDPEALRDLLHLFHGTVNTEVARLDGYVAQYKGDGALVYFGYPQAHEDDPQRAVLAARAIMAALAEVRRRHDRPLAAHIGIATGLAVVGDTFGQWASRERSAIGETPNLAARLSDLAPSGDIVVSAKTAQLAGHQFEFEALPPTRLKGIDEPVEAFRVLGERESDSLFDARRGPVRSAMVGRDAELARLLQRWDQARQGRGQVVFIHGEAGIGKSRLLRALTDALEGQDHRRLLAQCSPHHAQTALHPLRRPLAQVLGLSASASPAENQARLHQLLGDDDGPGLLAASTLMELELPTGIASLKLAPLALRQQTLGGLLAQLERAAGEQPLLLLLEDAHWIDPTTLELLQQAIQRVSRLRVLLVVTGRPEFELTLPEWPHVHHLHLARLGLALVGNMMERLSGAEAVAEDLVERIAVRTDGVPLFVEELYRSLVEGGALVRRGGVLHTRAPVVDQSIPASLHDSLMARLDHHRAHKALAQSAAVIGREFDVGLLARISDLSDAALETSLRGLVDAEIAYPIGRGDARIYAFRHALVRDAAYESLLIRHREELHARVLEALEPVPGTPPEVLARHASAAVQLDRAISHWMRAARQAMQRAAFQEAVSHLQEAVTQNGRLPADAARREQRLDLLLALGQAIIPWRGYSHSETVRVFDQAHALAEEAGDLQRSFWANYARWVVYYVRGEHLTAHRIACHMLERAEAAAHPGHGLAALRARGISEMILGQPAAAAASFRQAEADAASLRERQTEHRLAVAQRFAADPDIATQFHVALTHWARGERALALATSANAVASARAMGHVHTLGHALVHGAIVAVVDQDPATALALCAEATEFATLHGMDLWLGYAQILRGGALAQRGQVTVSAEALVAGLGRMSQMETGTMVPLHHAICAWALAMLGRREEAVKHQQLVQRELRLGCERYFWPDMLVWHAQCLALTPGGADAEVEMNLRMAVDEAQAQSAHAMGLKASCALGNHLLERGRLADAYRCLAQAIEQMPMQDDGQAWLQARRLQAAIQQRREGR